MRNNNHIDEHTSPTDVDQILDGAPHPRNSRARSKPKQGGGGAPPVASEEERRLDYSLRPRSLTEFIGQQQIKQVLGMSIEAAHKRSEPLEYSILGAAGLGQNLARSYHCARTRRESAGHGWTGHRTGR